MKRIYLDNAASTPLDPEVLDFMLPIMRDHFGNPSSIHDHGRKLRAIIEKARKEIAELLGAAPAEIFFTSGGTEADNMAIKCSVKGLGIKHIISSKIEHHAVIHPIEGLEAEGVKVTWLDADSKGNPDWGQLESSLKANPNSLVSLMHANNEIGTLIDLDRVGALCAEHGAILHSDTVQSMGNFRYNLSESNTTFLTASAHKFYGPRGVGFLYMKSGTMIPSLICGGSQERNVRAGTENVAAIAGMAFALGKCYRTFDEKNAKLRSLKSRMKAGLEDRFPGISFNGEISQEKSIPTVLNVCFPGAANSMLLFNLDINGISASGGSACTSGSVIGSHVLAGIGVEPEKAGNSVRFSFGVQNTDEEIDFVLDKVASMLKVSA